MISAAEYNRKNEELMVEYEERVRAWLAGKADETLVEKVPFFRDGVVSPETWFCAGNDFRPLFVLKEVSMGFDEVQKLDSYLEDLEWQKRFEFVKEPCNDVQIGKHATWTRMARLAKALEDVYNGNEDYDYQKYDFSFKPSEEKCPGTAQGDDKGKSDIRNANKDYNDIIRKIAVINMKKIGGGTGAGSEMSKALLHYKKHVSPFEDLLCRQIALIDPNVIIFCGRDGGCISKFFAGVKGKTNGGLWIDGYHPRCRSNYNFYETPLQAFKEHIRDASKL